MSIKDRLKEYLSLKNLSLRELERKCQISNGVLGRLTESTSPKTLKRIEENSDLNVKWLLTGEGEMLRQVDTILVEEKGDLDIFEDVPKKYISYLVPLAAMGGSLIGFEEEGGGRDRCERIVSPVANIDWVVPVCGDSMEPEYPNGSHVYVKEINHLDFIAWGHVYVLDTTNGIIIKVVEKSENEDCLRCVSLNPSGRYAPFDVPVRTIRRMYKVVLCAALK